MAHDYSPAWFRFVRPILITTSTRDFELRFVMTATAHHWYCRSIKISRARQSHEKSFRGAANPKPAREYRFRIRVLRTRPGMTPEKACDTVGLAVPYRRPFSASGLTTLIGLPAA